MTELIWEGKCKDGKKVAPVRLALPFQTIETVNESAQDRHRSLDLFAAGREGDWRNRLIWGDKKYVLPSLLPEFAGKVNLVYIDPPFDTGADFTFNATIPDHPETDEDESATFLKEPSILEQKAYRDTWGRGLESYLHWFYETALLLRELLADDGSLYVHIGWNVAHYTTAILDEVFGPDRFLDQLIWQRTNARRTEDLWPRIHDIILLYARAESPFFKPVVTSADPAKLPHTLITGKDGRKYQTYELTAPEVREKESGKPWRGFDPGKMMGRHWANLHATMDEWGAQGLIHWPAAGGFPRSPLCQRG